MINIERGQDGGPPSCGKVLGAGQRLSQHAGQEQRILMETLVRLQLGVYFQRVAFKARTLGSACLLMTHLGGEGEREAAAQPPARATLCSGSSCTSLRCLSFNLINFRFVLQSLNANSDKFQALSHVLQLHALFIVNVTA